MGGIEAPRGNKSWEVFSPLPLNIQREVGLARAWGKVEPGRGQQ
jgi:hypothetical protein